MSKITCFLLVLISFFCVPYICLSDDYSDLQKAAAAFKAEDYDQARTLFIQLAKQGNANAQYWIGHMFETGKGTSKNLDNAKNWYIESANNGFEPAKKRLQELSDNPRSVKVVTIDVNKTQNETVLGQNNISGENNSFEKIQISQPQTIPDKSSTTLSGIIANSVGKGVAWGIIVGIIIFIFYILEKIWGATKSAAKTATIVTLGTVIVATEVAKNAIEKQQAKYKKCSFCKTTIFSDATVCKHCLREVGY